MQILISREFLQKNLENSIFVRHLYICHLMEYMYLTDFVIHFVQEKVLFSSFINNILLKDDIVNAERDVK